MADVLCLGEILVDWVCTFAGAELDRAESFTKAAGGAPANVAVGLARQGVKTAFIGRTSFDEFGKWLKSVLEREGIDTRGTIVDQESQTRMAYVVTTASGDRKLAEFSRMNVADTRLCAEDLDESMFANASILHFGSISLIAEPAASATHAAIALAKRHGLLVSYDPNVRLGLWSSPEVCKHTILETLSVADIVKINVDELEFLTGSREMSSATRLQEAHRIPLLIITLDSRGAVFFATSGSETVPGFTIEMVEATGAGDGFVSGILSEVLHRTENATNRTQALSDLTLVNLVEIVRHANAVGALACTKPGAIPALPSLTEVKSFLEALAQRSPTSFRV